MQVFYINPVQPENLELLFKIEAVFQLITYINGAFVFAFLKPVRAHINLKILLVIGLTTHVFGWVARSIILSYQTGWIFYLFPNAYPAILNDCDNCSDPQYNTVIIVCSIVRCLQYATALSAMFWFSLERVFALFFVRDYENKPRKWIVAVIWVMGSIVCDSASVVHTYDMVSKYILICLGLFTGTFGFFLYLYIYYRSREIRRIAYQSVKGQSHTYTLSLRFQIDEILWSEKLMQNIYLTAAITFVPMLAFYCLSHTFLADQSELPTVQLYDTLFNLCLALEMPLMTIGSIVFNEYLRGMLRKFFQGETKVSPGSATNEGELYFGNLMKQWEMPTTEKKKKKITIRSMTGAKRTTLL